MVGGNDIRLVYGTYTNNVSLLFNMVHYNDDTVVRFDDGISGGTADGGDDSDVIVSDGSTVVGV